MDFGLLVRRKTTNVEFRNPDCSVEIEIVKSLYHWKKLGLKMQVTNEKDELGNICSITQEMPGVKAETKRRGATV